MTLITCANREEWLHVRKGDVTSTSVSALFGQNPWTTEFELFHRLAGNLEVEGPKNSRVTWGNRHQPAIAKGLIEDQGWTLLEDGENKYIKHPTIQGFGTSFDYIVSCPTRGKGMLEIKTAALKEYLEKWTKIEGEREAPVSYELQLQAQLMAAKDLGVTWGAIAVAFGINDDPLILFRELYLETEQQIEKAVVRFWKSIMENKPPTPDYEQDAEAVIKMNQAVQADKEADFTKNNRLSEICLQYCMEADKERDAARKKKAAKAEIFSMIGNAAKVQAADGYKINTFTMPAKEFKISSKPYRDMRVSKRSKE